MFNHSVVAGSYDTFYPACDAGLFVLNPFRIMIAAYTVFRKKPGWLVYGLTEEEIGIVAGSNK